MALPNQLPPVQYAPGNQRGFLNNIKDFFVGSPDALQQLPKLNPQQQDLQSMVGNQAGSLLQNIGNNRFDFGALRERATNEFNTKTIPSIANRFAGMGNQRGSDYQGALGAAGAGLQRDLSALESQFGLQQQGQDQHLLLSLISQALQPQNENLFTPGGSGFLQHIMPLLLKLGVGWASGGTSLPFV